ncbi:MAG: histidine phosphatase family protein [Cryobacterium sp.]|nr:histidine phosphatase family protein [Cryobacterium sp.]
MSGSITLHLVRHGESLWNVEGRYQGQADSGLTEEGRRQAEIFGQAFADIVPAPDAVVSSDLPRVMDTARQYADRVGAETRFDPALREMSVGDWAGRTLEEAAAKYPDIVAAVEAGEDIARGVGGETFSATRERVVAALTRVTADFVDSDREHVVVVFTSGNPIRLATAEVLGLPSPGHVSLGSPDNCSLTTFRIHNGRSELLRFNHDIAPARPADQREIS